MKDKLEVRGHIKLDFARKNGKTETFEYENTVTNAFYEHLTDELVTYTGIAMHNLMAEGDDGTVADGTKDGIILQEKDGDCYETDCTTHAGCGIVKDGDSIIVTAYTEKAAEFDGMALGKDMDTIADDGGDPSYSYKTIGHSVAAGDSLLITWTFSITPKAVLSATPI